MSHLNKKGIPLKKGCIVLESSCEVVEPLRVFRVALLVRSTLPVRVFSVLRGLPISTLGQISPFHEGMLPLNNTKPVGQKFGKAKQIKPCVYIMYRVQ